jgi:hypothetical protein
MILKEYAKTNNLSKHMLLKKNYPRNYITSIDLISSENELMELQLIQKYKNSIENKNFTKESNKSLHKLGETNFLDVKNALNKTPEKNEKIYGFITNNYSDEQNKIKDNQIITNYFDKKTNRANIHDVSRFPLILNKEFNTLKLNNENKYDSKKEQGINHKSKQISSNNINNRISKDLIKNVNISIIDYNKIYLKKESKPIKIYHKKSSSGGYNRVNKVNNYEKMKLQNYMKDRFYIDTEIKMNKKLKDIAFNHDHSLKDKIIEMKKIGGFWGGVVDYCNPVLSIKRFQYLKTKLNKNKIKKEDEWINKIQNISRNNKNCKNEIKTMRLFTINSYADYKHKKQLEAKKDFLEKYNDSLQYYMC